MRNHDLTLRERQVLARVMEGETSKEIGKALRISHRTVENYRARLILKYGARNTIDLARLVTIENCTGGQNVGLVQRSGFPVGSKVAH